MKKLVKKTIRKSSRFDNIKAGLEEAIEFANGNTKGARIHKVEVPDIDVQAARKKMGLSQDKFASSFGIPTSTLRNWEQGTREPRGAAKILLALINKRPDMVREVLEQYS